MPTLRIFEKQGDQVRVWFLADGEAGRELRDPIGHLGGTIDWRATAETCRPIGDEGVEIDIVFRDEES